jgi:hypothetical protein
LSYVEGEVEKRHQAKLNRRDKEGQYVNKGKKQPIPQSHQQIDFPDQKKKGKKKRQQKNTRVKLYY